MPLCLPFKALDLRMGKLPPKQEHVNVLHWNIFIWPWTWAAHASFVPSILGPPHKSRPIGSGVTHIIMEKLAEPSDWVEELPLPPPKSNRPLQFEVEIWWQGLQTGASVRANHGLNSSMASQMLCKKFFQPVVWLAELNRYAYAGTHMLRCVQRVMDKW